SPVRRLAAVAEPAPAHVLGIADADLAARGHDRVRRGITIQVERHRAVEHRLILNPGRGLRPAWPSPASVHATGVPAAGAPVASRAPGGERPAAARRSRAG